MIKVENVSKVFGKDFKAVDSLSVDINEGYIYGFLGPNGAGKTTTLKMLTGILTPDAGKISINGYDIVENPNEAKMEFAFVSDDPDMFLKLKGIEYLNFIGKVYKIDNATLKESILKYSEMFDMSSVLNDKIESYSHGMRQKIFVIGALIHNPKVWILDEPLTGLDPKSSHTLKQMMREHADNGNIVLFSTHVLEVAEKLCDHLFIINQGKLIYNGAMVDLKKTKDDSLEEIFLELVDND